MIQHLLVPLDGSRLAESPLPAAAYLAERFGARLTLLHCIEHHAPAEIHGERHLTHPAEAEAYLEEAAHRYVPASVRVEREVHTAEVAEVVVYAATHPTHVLTGQTLHANGGGYMV